MGGESTPYILVEDCLEFGAEDLILHHDGGVRPEIFGALKRFLFINARYEYERDLKTATGILEAYLH